MKTRGDELARLFFEQRVFPTILTTVATANEILRQTKINLHVFNGNGRFTGTPHVTNILLEHWRTLSERFVLFHQIGSCRLASGQNACNANTQKRTTRDEFIQRCRDERRQLIDTITRAAYHEQLHEEFPNRSASVRSSVDI